MSREKFKIQVISVPQCHSVLIPWIVISDVLIEQHDLFEKSPVLIQWRVIYLLDSVIQPMNNRGQDSSTRTYNKTQHSCRLVSSRNTTKKVEGLGIFPFSLAFMHFFFASSTSSFFWQSVFN